MMKTIRHKVQSAFSLTPMQEGMLYHKRMDEHTRFFFLQQCIQMDGQICETTLRQALALLSKRHEVLRTLFLYKKTEHPRQIILTEREIECRTVDLSGAGAGAKMAMNALLAEEQARGFDLEKDSLLRITLIDLPARQSVLVLNAHHIILDGWCFVMLFGDLKRYYEALSAGTSFSSLQASIAKTRRQTPDFGDYLARMERQDRRAGLSFWKEYLSDYMAPPRTPMAPPQNGNSETKKRTRAETRILGRDVGDPLSRLAARLEATVSTVLEAVWSILLMRRNHRRDVVFGKVISGRDLDMEAADRIVGIFINTIPVRATLAPGRTAARFIRELHEGSLSAMPFSDCALAEIQQQNPSGSRLIETLFIHENQFNYDPSVHKSTRTFGGMDCQIKPMTEHVGYPLAVKTALPGKLLLEILYEEPFDRREIVLMMDRFIAILMEIVADPEIEVDQIAALPERERTLVLRDFNRTVAPWPSEQTLAALVEAQVKRRPEQTALLFQDQAIRYDQLNRQANRLAHRLQQMGIGPEDRVMVSAPRSPLILVAMLAILKAGGCYLPVDPGDPDERIRFILADSEAKILLTTEDRFSTLNLPLLNLTDEETFLDPAENPAPVARPSHLACCVYTSGTTGYPKGVLVEHRNMVSYCMADNPFTDAVEVAPSPVILSTTSFCFDPFVTESLMALMRGWTILLADDETAEDQILLSRLAAAHGATALQTTPARLKLLMTWPEHRGYLNHLTAIGIGGEPFPGGLFTLIRRYTDAQIFNLYGLTETTVWSTVAPLDSEEIHIGKPGPNEMICIMDGWKPCGVGIPGELCIGGAGVARGYLNRPALSKEKFIKNPFWPGRMFRTGDLARWLPDGNLVHMGRMDDQIKLRGYRIEPAEIEGAMGRLPAVEHAAAALRPDPAGEPMLVGYVVSRASLDGNELQSMLRKTLPEYMIPAHILQIPALPLNRNGKVDRQALPTPAPSASVLAPLQSEEEKQIGAVFAAVLNLKTVSLHDNFFTLGGHSLRAARAAWLLEKQTGVRIPLRQWFDTPTVKGLARVLLEKKNPPPAAPQREHMIWRAGTGALDLWVDPALRSPIPPAEKKVSYPLSPAQNRIYIMSAMENLGTLYNLPMALTLRGEMDENRVRQALAALTERHESLRTSFHMEGDTPVQRIADRAVIPLCFEVLSDGVFGAAGEPGADGAFGAAGESGANGMAGAAGEGQANCTKGKSGENREKGADARPHIGALPDAFVRPFDLEKAPLFRVQIRTGGGHSLILLDMHHIISDGASIRLIMEEFTAFYDGKTLPPPAIQYRDYSQWLRSRDLSTQRDWWLKAFDGEIPTLNMPTDFTRPGIQTFKGGVTTDRINGSLAKKLRTLAAATGSAPFMTLLAVLMILLGRFSRQEDVVVGSPVSGRTHSQCQGTVGMFVGTLALRGRPVRNKSFRRFLSEVKQTCLAAWENQEYPFEDLVEAVNPRRDLSRNPLFDVMLAMQNNERPQTEGTGTTFLLAEGGPVTAKFDLTFNISEEGDGYRVDLIYATALYRQDSAARLLTHYLNLLHSAMADPEAKLSALSLSDPAERHQVLTGFQTPPSPGQKLRSFTWRFEARAAEHPDRPALVFGGDRLTYGRLNRLANRLARKLLAQGLAMEDIVAVYTGRGFDRWVGTLAVMKAGCAFLPLDPATPDSRVRFMLADSGARALICSASGPDFETGPGLVAAPGTGRAPSQAIHSDGEIPRFILSGGVAVSPEGMAEASGKSPDEEANLNLPIGPNHLAYCIYTSGTTGHPKGVLLEHRGMSNLADFFRDHLDVTAEDRILQFSSPAFDASVFEMTTALALGGTLQLIPEDAVTDPDRLQAALADCTVALLPPQMTGALSVQGLKLFLTGGSAASPETVRRAGDNRVYVNAYGPTEATVCATFWIHRKGGEIPARIPIGRPMPGVPCLILDGMEPCGIGQPGELCIGGIGVARGYLNRPALHAEKFMPDPFLRETAAFGKPGGATQAPEAEPAPSSLLYRTGDLVRWLPGGDIEFLGRLDDQIKIRGYRVEPGEIEHVLRSLPGVTGAAVTVREDPRGEPVIHGYVAGDPSPDLNLVRAELGHRLPDYMIPGRLALLDTLPLSASGKVDRSSLPEIEETAAAAEALIGREEELTARAFEEVLGGSGPGALSSFFALGGDSIKAIRMVSLFRSWGYDITVRQIIQLRDVRPIAAALRAVTETAGPQEPEAGTVPLTPIQKAFFQANYPKPSHFNQSLFLRFSGVLLEKPLREALTAIALHHDMLRAVYPGCAAASEPTDEPENYRADPFTSHPENSQTDTSTGASANDRPRVPTNDPANSQTDTATGVPANGRENRLAADQSTAPPVIQVVPDPKDSPLFDLKVFDLCSLPPDPDRVEAMNNAIQQTADLEKGPLFRVALYHYGGEEHIFLCAHHLIMDGVSWRILLEDLVSAYRQALRGKEIILPAKTVSFHRWALQLAAFGQTAAIGSELPLWQEALREAMEHDVARQNGDPAHPACGSRPGGQASPMYHEAEESESESESESSSGRQASPPPDQTAGPEETGHPEEGSHVEIVIPRETVNALLYEAGGAYDTEIIELLLSALSMAVLRWTGQHKVSVELESHGREELQEPVNVDRTLGWFTCTCPVTLPCQSSPAETIPAVKSILRQIPAHGIGYGLLADSLGQGGSKQWHPTLCFNYLGQMDPVDPDGRIALSPLPGGRNIAAENPLPNRISINGGIVDGVLTLHVDYDRDGWHRPSMEAFRDAFEDALARIVSHCVSKGKGLGDFAGGEMEQDEISEIQALFL